MGRNSDSGLEWAAIGVAAYSTTSHQCREAGIVLIGKDRDMFRDRDEFFEQAGFARLVQRLASLAKELLLQQRIGQSGEDDLVDHQSRIGRREFRQIPEAFQVSMSFFN